jgi:hypothetical protein
MKRATLFVVMAILLGGCAGSQALKGSGAIAPQPTGHAVACAKDPALPNCPKPVAAP